MKKRTCILILTTILSILAISCSDQDKITAAFQAGNELANGSPVPFLLEQNQPNPFDPVTSIYFSLYDTMRVSIKVYTEDWQEVATVMDKVLPGQSTPRPSYYEVIFNPGPDFPSGDYYYTMEGKGITQVRMMKCVK